MQEIRAEEDVACGRSTRTAGGRVENRGQAVRGEQDGEEVTVTHVGAGGGQRQVRVRVEGGFEGLAGLVDVGRVRVTWAFEDCGRGS